MGFAVVAVVLALGLIILADVVDSAWQPRLGIGCLVVFSIACFAVVLGIPLAVQFTAFSLKEEHFEHFALGMGLISAGAVVFDFARSAALREFAHQHAVAVAEVARVARRELILLHSMMYITLQVLTLFLFGLIMDSGVCFRAARTAYLYYLVSALVILLLRRSAKSKLESVFLRWGWAPIIAVGVPLLIREWKANGKILEYTFS